MLISLASTLFDAGVFCLFGVFFSPFGFVLFCFYNALQSLELLISVKHFNAHLLW